MDKNIAAFLRSDVFTVGVQFASGNPGESRVYDYVSNIPLSVTDLCLVEGKTFGLAIVTVIRVDSDLRIEPNSDQKYKYILSKIDLSAALALEEKNREVESTLAQHYQSNLRRSFAATVLQGLPPEGRDAITKLLG